MKQWEVIFWIIFILIMIWQAYNEFGWQVCYDGKEDCGHQLDWEPKKGDDIVDLAHRIQTGVDAPRLVVTRGLCIVTAAIISMTISFYAYRDIFHDIRNIMDRMAIL